MSEAALVASKPGCLESKPLMIRTTAFEFGNCHNLPSEYKVVDIPMKDLFKKATQGNLDSR